MIFWLQWTRAESWLSLCWTCWHLLMPLITVLLGKLQNWFGISGHALNWLSSYLTGRSQQIKLEDVLSPEAQLPFGVPQGSVLGPLLCTLYTTPLSNGHSRPFHTASSICWWQSTLYIIHLRWLSKPTRQFESCLDSVLNWMLHNRSKLNSSKADFLLIGHEQQWKKYLSCIPVRQHVKIIQWTFATCCEMSGKFGGRQSLGYGQLSQTVTKLSCQELVLD